MFWADTKAKPEPRLPESDDEDRLTLQQLEAFFGNGTDEDDAGGSEGKAAKSLPKLSTAPTDPRFPNINQTRACWQNYVDYLKCVRIRDEEYRPCRELRRLYTILCPSSWIERWEAAREEGVSPHVDAVERELAKKSNSLPADSKSQQHH